MKKSLKKKIALFYRYLTRISLLKGFMLFAKLHLLKFQWGVTVPMLKYPIYLRKRTTDLATFERILNFIHTNDIMKSISYGDSYA